MPTRLAPNVASHWKELGQAHWAKARSDPSAAQSSESALLNCLQRDPKRGDCHCSPGFIQHSQGNHRDALQSFTRAAEHGSCKSRTAEELLELGEFEQASLFVRTELARTPARPGNFDKLYVLHALELRIASQRGDLAQAEATRQKLTQYTLELSPEVAFNLGSTYAVSEPRQPIEAKQLLNHFVQSSCDERQIPNDCAQCGVARDLLAYLDKLKP